MNARLPVDSIQQHIDAFRRHRWKALTFFLVVVIGATAALLVMPGTYDSSALLFVKLGRESVTLDAVATTGQTVNVSEGREFEINTVAEVLANDGLASKVVEKMGSDRFLRNEDGLEKLYDKQGIQGFAKLQIAKLFEALKRSGTGSDAERAANIVIAGRSVYPTPRSGLVQISTRANTPELARDILETMIDEYLSQHVSMHRSSGSENFFTEQTAVLQKRLAEAESELAKLKNDSGMLSVDGSRGQLQKQMDLIEQQRTTVMAQLAGSKSHADSLAKSVASIPERMTTSETTGLPNVARDAMRQQLYLQEIELKDMQSRLTESHPQVVSAKKKNEEVRRIL